MEFQSRRMLPGQRYHTEVCHDDRISAEFLKKPEVTREAFKFVFTRERIACDIDTRSPGMRQVDGRRQFFIGEISRCGAHAEGMSRQIHGVGSVQQSHTEPFFIAGGTQKFRPLNHNSVWRQSC